MADRAQETKTILLVAANPSGLPPLQLDKELREIQGALERAQERDRFTIEYQTAARPRDIQRALLRHTPYVVHFCGHGKSSAGLCLENESGESALVSTEALAELFACSQIASKLSCSMPATRCSKPGRLPNTYAP